MGGGGRGWEGKERKTKGVQTHSLRRTTPDAAQEAAGEDLPAGPGEPAGRVEGQVDEVGVLEDADAAEQLGQRGQDEGPLGEPEQEDGHDEGPGELALDPELGPDVVQHRRHHRRRERRDEREARHQERRRPLPLLRPV